MRLRVVVLVLAAAACEAADPVDAVRRSGGDVQRVELRWTGSHGECRPLGPDAPIHICDSATTGSQHGEVAEVAARIRGSRRPRDLYGAGLVELLFAGNEGDARRAVNLLLEAELADPSAEILNDQAVSWALVGAYAGTTTELYRALDTALRAIALDPEHVEARANVALLAERLGLTADTATSESRARLIELVDAHRLPETLPDGARESLAGDIAGAFDHITRTWLPLWASRATERTSILHLTEQASDVLESAGSGALAEVLAAHAVPRAEPLLARGYLTYREGRAEYAASHYARSDSLLAVAGAALAAAGSPLADWALLYRAAAAGQAGDPAAAITLLSDLLERERPDPILRARVFWLAALSEGRLGHIDRESELLDRAEEAYEAAAYRPGVDVIRSLRAETQFLVGQSEAALAGATAALRAMADDPNSVPRHTTLTYTGAQLRELGLAHAALFVHREALAVAVRSERAVAAIESTVRVARAAPSIEPVDSVRALLARADSSAAALPDTATRSRMLADVGEAIAELELNDAPASAIARLDTVIARFGGRGSQYRLASALAMRGAGRLLVGRDSAGTVDLAQAVGILGSSTSGPPAEARLDATRERLSSAFDVAIGRYAAQGDAFRALAILELSRADPGETPASVRRTLERLQMPTDAALLVWAVLPDRIVSWAITSDTLAATTIMVDEADLRRRVEALERSVLHGSADDVRSAAEPLYPILVEPLARVLTARRRWILIPDRILFRVPFAVLNAPGDRAWLIDVHELSFALRTGSIDALQSGAASAGTSLIVGNPAVDRTLHPDLVDLAGAAAEARAVAARLPTPVLLEGPEAGEQAVRARLPAARVLHFAGHALQHPADGNLSHLVLASHPDTLDGRLTTQEIRALSLPQLDLAVLSACTTLDGTDARVGRLDGLAGAFLGAGAGAVVASLWPVEDRGTAALFTDFYEVLATGVGPAAALRSAQRAAAAAGVAPRGWAAFQVVERVDR